MRSRLGDNEKELLRGLNDAKNGVLVGPLVGFAICGMGLLIERNPACVVLLYDEDKQSLVSKSIKGLIGCLSLLRQAEQASWIYCVDSPERADLFLNGKRNEVVVEKGGQSFVLDGGKVTINEGQAVYKNKLGEILMTGICLDKALSKDIVKYIGSIAFSTPLLDDFIANKFHDEEQVRYLKQLCYTRVALVVSFVALFISPLFNVCCANKFGYTTVDETQFQTIKDGLERITKSVSIEKFLCNCDTTICADSCVNHK